MKGVLRIVWVFYTASRIQRWLGVTGCILAGLSALGAALGGRPGGFAVPATLLSIFVMFPAVFLVPGLLRDLTVLRDRQLWPRFRPRMLAAVLLFAATPALAWELIAGVPLLLAGRSVPTVLFVYPLGIISAVFCFFWLIWVDLRFAFVLGPLVAVGIPAFKTGLVVSMENPLFQLAVLSASVLYWTVFGIWYLRATNLGSTGRERVDRCETRSEDVAITRQSAIGVVLGNQLRNVEHRPMAWLVAVIPFIILGCVGLSLPPDNSLSMTSLFAVAMPWGITHALAAILAGRSRLLWLNLAGNRNDLWRLVESSAWRKIPQLSVIYVLVTFCLSAPSGLSTYELPFGAALAVSSNVYGLYLKLAAVPGLATQVFGYGVMGLAQAFLLSGNQPDPIRLSVAVMLLLLGAAFMRALAAQRWQAIDWRLVKLPRATEQPGLLMPRIFDRVAQP